MISRHLGSCNSPAIDDQEPDRERFTDRFPSIDTPGHHASNDDELDQCTQRHPAVPGEEAGTQPGAGPC